MMAGSWWSGSREDQDGSLMGVYGQRYDAGGNTVNGEFLINTETNDKQQAPSVAALAGGGFVVTWRSRYQDGDGNGIYAQQYDAGGIAVGSEFQVNTETADNQKGPSVAALQDGGFVIVWNSMLQDGDVDGVFGQRFDASGNPVGLEFQINTETTDGQKQAVVSRTR